MGNCLQPYFDNTTVDIKLCDHHCLCSDTNPNPHEVNFLVRIDDDSDTTSESSSEKKYNET